MEVNELVFNDSFQKDVEEIVSVSKPLVEVLGYFRVPLPLTSNFKVKVHSILKFHNFISLISYYINNFISFYFKFWCCIIVGGGKPTKYDIYEATDKAKEAIKNTYGDDGSTYMPLL